MIYKASLIFALTPGFEFQKKQTLVSGVPSAVLRFLEAHYIIHACSQPYATVPRAPELENKGVCAAHSRRCAHRPPKLAVSLEHNIPSTVGRETRMRAAPSWPPRAQRAPKGTNSRREPPSAPPSAPEPLTSCTPSSVGIKTGLFWYSAALSAAPGAPCALKRSSRPSCPKRKQTAARAAHTARGAAPRHAAGTESYGGTVRGHGARRGAPPCRPAPPAVPCAQQAAGTRHVPGAGAVRGARAPRRAGSGASGGRIQTGSACRTSPPAALDRRPVAPPCHGAATAAFPLQAL